MTKVTREELLSTFVESLKLDKEYLNMSSDVPYARGVISGYNRAIKFIEYILQGEFDGEDQD